MEKFIFHVKMFLDKKDTETARLIREWIMDAKRNDGKIFDAFGFIGIERNFSLYTRFFPPYFFKSDRLRSLQFREKSHAKFCLEV